MSLQSQISVIDTAIVRSTADTTRRVYSFNATPDVASDLTQRLTGELWVNLFRQTYTYYANGNRLSEVDETWSNDQWVRVNGSRYTNTYDANGNKLLSLYEQWSNGQWVNSFRGTITYDAHGNLLSLLYESSSNGQWVNYMRYTHTYDASGDMLSELNEYWSSSGWVNNQHITRTYDANGNMLSDLVESWSNGQWGNGSRNTNTYDVQENLTSVWFYSWLNSSWTPTDFEGEFGYVVTESATIRINLNRGYNFTFTRKLIVTEVASQSGSVPAAYSLWQNYPNPFNPSTTIGYALPQRSHLTLTVFNSLGQQVATLVNEIQEAGYHDVRFDGNGLASGVYFYRLQAGGFVQTKQFVLLR